MKEINLYISGSGNANMTGTGGFGGILSYNDHIKEFSCGLNETNTSRMELRGILTGIQMLKEPCKVTVFLQNKLIVDAFEQGWVENWQRKGYFIVPDSRIKHTDLYRKIYAAIGDHDIEFRHNNHNRHWEHTDRCKELAKIAKRQPNLEVDEPDHSDLDLLKRIFEANAAKAKPIPEEYSPFVDFFDQHEGVRVKS